MVRVLACGSLSERYFSMEDVLVGRLSVYTTGHEWADGYIVTKEEPGQGLTTEYSPLEAPALHRAFAEKKPNDKGFIAFADKYGFLRDPEPRHVGNPLVRLGEPFHLWEREHRYLRRLVELWDHVRLEDKKALRPHVRWTPESPFGHTVVRVSPDVPFSELRAEEEWTMGDPVVPIVAHADSPDPAIRSLLGRWKHDDPIEPVRYYIAKHVNDNLKNLEVAPAVLPYRNGDIVFVPRSLLGAIYCHFAVEISGKGRPTKECSHCGKHFTPVSSKQIYHSNACRVGAHKKKKKGAENA